MIDFGTDNQEKIFFASNRSGTVDIWMCDPDGTNPSQLTNKPGAEYDARISPDGSKILYQYIYNNSQEIWVMNIDGTNDHIVAMHKSRYGRWAPDGDKIIYHRDTGGSWNGTINMINIDGTNDQVLLQPFSPYTGVYPQHWQSGKIIFQASYSHSGNNRLFIMDENTSNILQLSTQQSERGMFSPDGKEVLFGSNFNIRIVNIDGTNDRLIFANNAIRYAICFSPDGSKIAFAIGTEDDIVNDNLALINTDGTNFTVLTNTYDTRGPSNWAMIDTQSTSVGHRNTQIPIAFWISQNYPNPFNSSTLINYSLTNQCYVKIKVYDVVGREVKTLVSEEKRPGDYYIRWDGRSRSGQKVASGLYFYSIHAGDFHQTKKMLLTK
jgi:Tol biopolymer transport system component